LTLPPPPSLDFKALFEAVPGLYLVVLPDVPRYTIVAVSDAFARATLTKREEIIGRGLFEVFPDDRAGHLVASLGRVLSKRGADAMEPELEDGREKRWWSPKNSPVFGPGGDIAYIIHSIEDVTEKYDLQQRSQLFAAAQRDRWLVAADRERLLALATSLFDQASDAIFVADVDGRFTDVNAASCTLLGYSRQELIEKTIEDIIPSDDLPRLIATRAHLLSPGAVHVAEWTLLAKDGTPIPVEVSAKILPDGRWQAFVRDIRERKRVETELRDAHAFLDAIIENIPLMLFIKECTALRFVRFNRAGEALLGWPRQMLVGKNDFDFWPQEQAQFFVDRDRETLRTGAVLDIVEEPIRTRHQGIRILHTKKVPILDRSGNPLYLLGISEDITERKQLEDERRLLAEVNVALSASIDYEQTLATVTRLAVQHVADWCCVDVFEEHGELRRLKVASADPADEALCAVLERMPPRRDLPHLSRFVLEGGRPFIVENLTPELVESFVQSPEHLEAARATGVTSLIGVPLLSRGKPFGVLLFASSNHHRVYGPSDLRWAEAIADRSAVAIENARLYRASVQASLLREQVLGVVAHDLRNPLSTILLQEAAIRARRGSEGELDVIRRAARRMHRLIQDLLDVSLTEAGTLPLNKTHLSATDLIVESVELQKALATSSIELRIDAGIDIPEVWGDRDRLLQVFENLIGNALKFTSPGGCITVGATSKDREVVFFVADTGCGIAPDALPHVFDKFWQATRGDRRGAGLGLPIVRGIVEAHGGHVWVESALGRGSTFFFSIPKGDSPLDQPAATVH
jgi:PAS domain S-box-containing protein